MMKRLSKQGFEQVARKFRLLGDPVRLEILDQLQRAGELTVGEVAEGVACSQPNASRHLGRLFEGRILARRREGATVFYYIDDPSIFELCDAVCGRLEKEAARGASSLYAPRRTGTRAS